VKSLQHQEGLHVRKPDTAYLALDNETDSSHLSSIKCFNTQKHNPERDLTHECSKNQSFLSYFCSYHQLKEPEVQTTQRRKAKTITFELNGKLSTIIY